jgi:hypothetical protein
MRASILVTFAFTVMALANPLGFLQGRTVKFCTKNSACPSVSSTACARMGDTDRRAMALLPYAPNHLRPPSRSLVFYVLRTDQHGGQVGYLALSQLLKRQGLHPASVRLSTTHSFSQGYCCKVVVQQSQMALPRLRQRGYRKSARPSRRQNCHVVPLRFRLFSCKLDPSYSRA